MSICLTVAELIELSGYYQAAATQRWLKRNNIKFLVGADGKPRVLRDDLFNKPKTLTPSKPNITALTEMQKRGRHGKTQNQSL